MFEFNLDEASLVRFRNSLVDEAEDFLKFGLDKVRDDWGAELERQRRSNGDGNWQPLSSDYAERKQKSKLTRNRGLLDSTGFMMRGYLNGISVDYANYTVTIPFPTGTDSRGYDVTVRAKSHQGVIGQPTGVPPRPFDLSRFEEIARDRLEKTINDALNSFNKSRGRRRR